MTQKSGINWTAYETLQLDLFELAQKKNKQYGTESLLLFNGTAILCRMNDKIERLNTMYENQEFQVCDESLKELYDESIIDSLMDLINYSMYLILLRDGDITSDKLSEPLPDGSCN